MTYSVETRVYSEERDEFHAYLRDAGFGEFNLTTPNGEIYLRLEFEDPQSSCNYMLRGIEERYKASRGHRYYADLDEAWDEEAAEFFGEDEYDL